MSSLSEKVASFVYGLTLDRVPKDVVEKAKEMLLDYFATTLAGVKAKGSPEIAELSRSFGKGDVTILGFGYKTSTPYAALANGTIGHALDYDDTHSKAIFHPTVVVAPAALAIAEEKGLSGKEFLEAFIAGVEVDCKLGLCARIGPLQLGYIYTALIGTFGAAAASAKLMGLDEKGIAMSLGVAYSLTSGNAQQLVEGTLSKRLQAGIAAMNGVLSALIASKGFTGAKEVFEGKFGFFNVYLRGEYDSKPIDELGVSYEIPYVSFKPYSCCRLTHTAIDATLKLKEKYNLKPDDIKKVLVGVNRQAYNANAQPIEIKRKPRNIVDAQFSIPYVVACALVYGKVSLSDFTDEAICREDVLRIAELVEPYVDEEIESKYGRVITPARVKVVLKDGSSYAEEVIHPLGEPENPMSREMLINKFVDAAEYSGLISKDKAKEISEIILSVEDLKDVRELTKLLT